MQFLEQLTGMVLKAINYIKYLLFLSETKLLQRLDHTSAIKTLPKMAAILIIHLGLKKVTSTVNLIFVEAHRAKKL